MYIAVLFELDFRNQQLGKCNILFLNPVFAPAPAGFEDFDPLYPAPGGFWKLGLKSLLISASRL